MSLFSGLEDTFAKLVIDAIPLRMVSTRPEIKVMLSTAMLPEPRFATSALTITGTEVREKRAHDFSRER
jgi:hypothetical protein